MSSPKELTVLSYLILGLVGEGGEGAHDLVRMMRQGRVYYTASASQLYAEPKRLASLGYLDVRAEPGRTRERRVYTLTEKGRGAVRAWMSEPASAPRLQHEASIRVLCGDLAGNDRVLESLRGMRAEVEAVLADVAAMDEQAARFPHRSANLRLNHWLGRRWCELNLAWLDEAERALGSSRE